MIVRALDGLPELQPLNIGRERVYYITMFSKAELIALCLAGLFTLISIYSRLTLYADGRVSQEIEVSDVSWTLEFKEQPNVTAFALERRKQSILNGKCDSIIFEKYALQSDGLFAMTSRDSFLVNISASPDRIFTCVNRFRLLAFATIEMTGDLTTPRVLEPRELPDTNNIFSQIGTALWEGRRDWMGGSTTSSLCLRSRQKQQGQIRGAH
ncbi:hypothetical protein GX51_07028 [Blastomyces parvus]|uniref:Uncharacterized protein n=1 Tax=Blastomyces parvus TaxID=2060905 RepID=A0A2B7WN30_9EURO|nr:hypothetical protein GX51_07028 [Blastomyces parvus]